MLCPQRPTGRGGPQEEDGGTASSSWTSPTLGHTTNARKQGTRRWRTNDVFHLPLHPFRLEDICLSYPSLSFVDTSRASKCHELSEFSFLWCYRLETSKRTWPLEQMNDWNSLCFASSSNQLATTTPRSFSLDQNPPQTPFQYISSEEASRISQERSLSAITRSCWSSMKVWMCSFSCLTDYDILPKRNQDISFKSFSSISIFLTILYQLSPFHVLYLIFFCWGAWPSLFPLSLLPPSFPEIIVLVL